MFLSTQLHKNIIDADKHRYSLRIGNKVPYGAINLAYYYNRNILPYSSVLISEAPKNIIDHRISQQWLIKRALPSNSNSFFPPSISNRDEDGYSGELQLKFVDWTKNDNVLKETKTETGYVYDASSNFALRIDRRHAVCQMYSGTEYLMDVSWLIMRYKDIMGYNTDSKEFTYALSTYPRECFTTDVFTIMDPNTNSLRYNSFPITIPLVEDGYIGELNKNGNLIVDSIFYAPEITQQWENFFKENITKAGEPPAKNSYYSNNIYYFLSDYTEHKYIGPPRSTTQTYIKKCSIPVADDQENEWRNKTIQWLSPFTQDMLTLKYVNDSITRNTLIEPIEFVPDRTTFTYVPHPATYSPIVTIPGGTVITGVQPYLPPIPAEDIYSDGTEQTITETFLNERTYGLYAYRGYSSDVNSSYGYATQGGKWSDPYPTLMSTMYGHTIGYNSGYETVREAIFGLDQQTSTQQITYPPVVTTEGTVTTTISNIRYDNNYLSGIAPGYGGMVWMDTMLAYNNSPACITNQTDWMKHNHLCNTPLDLAGLSNNFGKPINSPSSRGDWIRYTLAAYIFDVKVVTVVPAGPPVLIKKKGSDQAEQLASDGTTVTTQPTTTGGNLLTPAYTETIPHTIYGHDAVDGTYEFTTTFAGKEFDTYDLDTIYKGLKYELPLHTYFLTQRYNNKLIKDAPSPIPDKWTAQINYKGALESRWIDYDGAGFYEGATIKHSAIGNGSAMGSNQLLMYPDDDGILYDLYNKKEIESEDFNITNKFKDGVPLFYRYKLKYKIFNSDGPNELGMYVGNSIKLLTGSMRPLNNNKYKYDVELVLADPTKTIEYLKNIYHVYIYTSFLTTSNFNVLCSYNAYNDEPDIDIIDRLMPNTIERIDVQPFYEKNIDYSVINTEEVSRTNYITIVNNKVIIDTRKVVRFNYTVRTTDNMYTSNPIYADAINLDYALDCELGNYIGRNLIVSPVENGEYLNAFEIIKRDCIKQLYNSSNQYDHFLLGELTKKTFIVEFSTNSNFDFNNGLVNLFTKPDGSGIISVETTVDTGFEDSKGTYTRKIKLPSKSKVHNKKIYPAYQVMCKDARPIKVLPSRDIDFLDNWYPRIQFSHFSQVYSDHGMDVKNTYSMPEFDEQFYSSFYGKPYIDVVNEKAKILNDNFISVKNFPIYVQLDKDYIPVNLKVRKLDINKVYTDMTISKWNYTEGVIELIDVVSENDNILVDYTYDEQSYVYRGYYDDMGEFIDLDTNPSKYHDYLDHRYTPYERRNVYNLFNTIIYFFISPSKVSQIKSYGDFLTNTTDLFPPFITINKDGYTGQGYKDGLSYIQSGELGVLQTMTLNNFLGPTFINESSVSKTYDYSNAGFHGTLNLTGILKDFVGYAPTTTIIDSKPTIYSKEFYDREEDVPNTYSFNDGSYEGILPRTSIEEAFVIGSTESITFQINHTYCLDYEKTFDIWKIDNPSFDKTKQETKANPRFTVLTTLAKYEEIFKTETIKEMMISSSSGTATLIDNFILNGLEVTPPLVVGELPTSKYYYLNREAMWHSYLWDIPLGYSDNNIAYPKYITKKVNGKEKVFKYVSQVSDCSYTGFYTPSVENNYVLPGATIKSAGYNNPLKYPQPIPADEKQVKGTYAVTSYTYHYQEIQFKPVYSGIVNKGPAIDDTESPIYTNYQGQYSGDVVKSDHDTRVWRQNYISKAEQKTTFEKTLYHKFGDSIPTNKYDILIGSVHVRQSASLKSTELVDTRSRGGGVLEEIYDSIRRELEPESDYYWDIGSWDGEGYTENAIVILRLDKRILKEYGGKFTADEVEGVVHKWIASGVMPIIEYVTTYTKEELPQSTLSVKSDYVNKIYDTHTSSNRVEPKLNETLIITYETKTGIIDSKAITLNGATFTDKTLIVPSIDYPLDSDGYSGTLFLSLPVLTVPTGTYNKIPMVTSSKTAFVNDDTQLYSKISDIPNKIVYKSTTDNYEGVLHIQTTDSTTAYSDDIGVDMGYVSGPLYGDVNDIPNSILYDKMILNLVRYELEPINKIQFYGLYGNLPLYFGQYSGTVNLISMVDDLTSPIYNYYGKYTGAINKEGLVNDLSKPIYNYQSEYKPYLAASII